MKVVFLAIGVLFIGCWQSKYVYYEDILNRPSSSWAEHDCRAVIEANADINKFDLDAPVTAVAVPLNPQVITAINRENQGRNKWTERFYIQSMQEDLHRYLGMSIDTTTEDILDASGKIYRNESQLDSLLFIITIVKRSNTDAFIPIFNSIDQRLYSIYQSAQSANDLNGFTERVYLQNSVNLVLKPNWFGGREGAKLVAGETFIVMFQLQHTSFHFFEDSNEMKLIIRGFERDIQLRFPLYLTKKP